jgi:hypothetical protein
MNILIKNQGVQQKLIDFKQQRRLDPMFLTLPTWAFKTNRSQASNSNLAECVVILTLNDGNQGDEILRNLGGTPGGPSSNESHDATQATPTNTTTDKESSDLPDHSPVRS